jgi:hypothetical protein
MANAHLQPIGGISHPNTAKQVAMSGVPITALNSTGARRVDQNGPQVRVTKLVRWPATESFRYISV